MEPPPGPSPFPHRPSRGGAGRATSPTWAAGFAASCGIRRTIRRQDSSGQELVGWSSCRKTGRIDENDAIRDLLGQTVCERLEAAELESLTVKQAEKVESY